MSDMVRWFVEGREVRVGSDAIRLDVGAVCDVAAAVSLGERNGKFGGEIAAGEVGLLAARSDGTKDD